MSDHSLFGRLVSLAHLADVAGVSPETMDRRLLVAASAEDALTIADRGILKRISEKFNLDHTTLRYRINRGSSARDAVFTPLRPINTAKSGDIFWRLTLLQQIGKTAASKPIWLCKCECGGETRGVLADLKSGQKKSCGCLHREMASQRLLARSGLDAMIGQTFHRLTVLARASDYPGAILCRCACGNERVFTSTNVLAGGTKSCGCLKSEGTAERCRRRATVVTVGSGKHKIQDIAADTGIRKETLRQRIKSGYTPEQAIALGPGRSVVRKNPIRTCGICGDTGHNRRNCNALISP